MARLEIVKRLRCVRRREAGTLQRHRIAEICGEIRRASKCCRKPRGGQEVPGDGLWFAVSGGRVGVDFRQSGQFARLGGRRWRRAFVERDRIDFWSGYWIYRPWRRGKAAADRVSRTRKARPAAEYGVAAARLLRDRRSRLAGESGDRAQEGAKGRGKENDRWGRAMRVCAIRIGFPANEPVTIRAVDPDGQTVKCESNCGRSSSLDAKQPQSVKLGRNGEVERLRSVLSPTANG